MKNPLSSFFATRASETQPGAEPALVPMGVPAAPRAQQQINQALAQICQHIAAQEVQDLLDTVPNCRFQLWTLTFWLSTANQGALRGLIALNQRDAQLAKQHVQGCFAKSDAAHLLNTVRLKLEFKAGDSLPRDASEVLVVCGRDNVTLPYSYTGQFEVADDSASGVSGATLLASQASSPTLNHRATPPTAGVPANTLHLWAQWPGESRLQRWRAEQGVVTVGAGEAATIRIEHRHVSGEHLVLSQNNSGQWLVEDRGRNGTNLFDASAAAPVVSAKNNAANTTANVSGDAEQPLPTRQPRLLPLAGALRLGPLPDDPLLHFQQSAPALPPAMATAAAPTANSRRVTQLASDIPWPSTGMAGGPRGTATA